MLFENLGIAMMLERPPRTLATIGLLLAGFGLSACGTAAGPPCVGQVAGSPTAAPNTATAPARPQTSIVASSSPSPSGPTAGTFRGVRAMAGSWHHAAPPEPLPGIEGASEPTLMPIPLPAVTESDTSESTDRNLRPAKYEDVPASGVPASGAPATRTSATLMAEAARPTANRSPRLIEAAAQADAHNRHGFELANRSATFSARAEFMLSLRLIATASDEDSHSLEHTQALAHGMRALEEADDFLPRAPRLDAEIDAKAIARAHRSPVFAGQIPDDLSVQVALDRYHTYAVTQLARAGGKETSSSLALHAVGKLHGVFARQQAAIVVEPESKAIVFNRAALEVDPNNYLAANDLAVLLAKRGQYPEARDLLIRAVAIAPQPAMWHNLAVIHDRLGEHAAAQLARRLAISSSGGVNPASLPDMTALHAVRWVDPARFTQLSRPPADLNPAPPVAKPAATKAAAVTATTTAADANTGGIARRVPWGTRQQ